ncbi:MAG TPA: hypothetical protein VES65_09225 [Solirubrobacteraceae bacterium]|nr:hypothetical protein [Solirubrobacteraceae bacterium]
MSGDPRAEAVAAEPAELVIGRSAAAMLAPAALSALAAALAFARRDLAGA